MLTITTATGKTFDSDFAGAAGEYAIIQIINSDMSTVLRVFSDENELPIVGFEEYTTIANIVNEGNGGIKLVLQN